MTNRPLSETSLCHRLKSSDRGLSISFYPLNKERPMPGLFAFELSQRVQLAGSLERGIVKARAEYLHSENQYLVHYLAGDGRMVDAWWGESDLVSAS